jgi:ABC-type multidrug transport system fused ATPase/permease subunit
MHPAALAFQRAKKLLSDRTGRVWAVRILGILDAILILALFLGAGLLLHLFVSRGVAFLTPEQAAEAPLWLKRQLPNRITTNVLVTDTGLYPFVANNQTQAQASLGNNGSAGSASTTSGTPVSRSPWTHRQVARLVRRTQIRLLPLQSNLGTLMILLAAEVALLLALSLVRQVRKNWTIDLAEAAADSLRRQIHRQMYRLGQSSLPTEGTGPAVNLFSRDVNDVRDGLIADLDRTYFLPVLGGGLLAIALVISLKLAVFLVSLGGLCWVLTRTLDRSARQQSDAAARDASVQLCLLQEDLGMLRTVRVYGMESIDKARFDEHLDNYRGADGRRMRTIGGTSPTTFLVVGATAILATGLLGYVVIESGPNHLSVAGVVMLAAALIGLYRPLNDWLAQRRPLRQAGRSAAGIFEFLERRPELQQAVGAQFLAPLHQRISFENVSLDAANGRPLLSGVSAEITAKARTAIVSLDEAAKLAMACAIPRLIDPKVGRIRMDGIDLRDITLESLRAQVATVLQADLVFSDSVIANIGLGDPSYGLPRIVEAAKVAHAHHFIQDLPDGYDTLIGPLGHYLKPDEQYRIALARAFLHDPSIVIIEEPVNSLDDDVKQLIDDTIDRLAPGRTLIFLPHRLSTIRKCDQVLVLHNGRIEAAGPHRDIHLHNKLYRHILYVEFNQFATGEIEAGQMNS